MGTNVIVVLFVKRKMKFTVERKDEMTNQEPNQEPVQSLQEVTEEFWRMSLPSYQALTKSGVQDPPIPSQKNLHKEALHLFSLVLWGQGVALDRCLDLFVPVPDWNQIKKLEWLTTWFRNRGGWDLGYNSEYMALGNHPLVLAQKKHEEEKSKS